MNEELAPVQLILKRITFQKKLKWIENLNSHNFSKMLRSELSKSLKNVKIKSFKNGKKIPYGPLFKQEAIWFLLAIFENFKFQCFIFGPAKKKQKKNKLYCPFL